MAGYKDEEEMREGENKSYNKRSKKEDTGEMVRIRHFTWDTVEEQTRLRVNKALYLLTRVQPSASTRDRQRERVLSRIGAQTASSPSHHSQPLKSFLSCILDIINNG